MPSARRSVLLIRAWPINMAEPVRDASILNGLSTPGNTPAAGAVQQTFFCAGLSIPATVVRRPHDPTTGEPTCA
jgi:hypothetical protein